MTLQRRWLIGAAAAAAAAALSGCGFELRRPPHFAFQTLYINPISLPIGQELKRLLAIDGSVQVLTEPGDMLKAQAILDVLRDQIERIPVGMGIAGTVTEIQLRQWFKFRLRTPQGEELIAETELLLQRDVTYSETVALNKDMEEVLLRQDMQNDMAQQIMRRLAALKKL